MGERAKQTRCQITLAPDWHRTGDIHGSFVRFPGQNIDHLTAREVTARRPMSVNIAGSRPLSDEHTQRHLIPAIRQPPPRIGSIRISPHFVT